MSSSFVFTHRTDSGVRSSSNLADILLDWQGENERWLFVAPHDDDIVLGAGLTLLAGVHHQVDIACIVATDGRMGYCHLEQQHTIAAIRQAETLESFKRLGIPNDRLLMLNYPDGSLCSHAGRRFATKADTATNIAGATGLQNSFTWALRSFQPNRVFLSVHTDLHPDHKMVHHEFLISVFHAQGAIWPELGSPIPAIPRLYEYATYSDYASPPDLRIQVSDDVLERKLEAFAVYKSQKQADLVLQNLRQAGPQEYIREMAFDLIQPQKYDAMFA